MDNLKRIKFAREGGAVKRCHVHTIVGEYTNSQHCFNMACMARVLFPNYRKEFFFAILSHDLPERITGDIPAPAKWFKFVDNEHLSVVEEHILQETGFNYNLDEDEMKALKGLDILEFYLWCMDQRSFGNTNVNYIIETVEEFIQENVFPYHIMNIFLAVKRGDWKTFSEMEFINGRT